MTEDSRSDPVDAGSGASGPHVTRRGVLAVGGATLLAGCGLPGVLGPGSVELDGDDLAAAASGDHPTVRRPLPVDVTDEHVSQSRERAHSLLSSVPLPLSAEELPNGAMREELHERAEHARTHLSEAVEAPGARERLELLAHARGPARCVAGAWEFTRDELSAADVRTARQSVVEDARQFDERRELVGADPVRAVIVHDLVDQWTESARSHARSARNGDRVDPVTVGERAADVEEGRASLADAEHVFDRFSASLAEPRSIRETLVDARDALASTIDSRMSDVPRERDALSGQLDVDLEETVAGHALEGLHSDLPTGEEIARADGLAATILAQIDGLARLGAFETLRERIESGDHRTVERVEDVRALRSAAVTALEDALAASADDRLARTVLADPGGWFDYAERELGEFGDAVEVSRAARDLALYLELETIATATPAAVDEALAALDAE